MTVLRETKLEVFLKNNKAANLNARFDAMKCKCYFTKHLYQYLKAEKLGADSDKITSDNFEINLLGLSKQAKVSKNTTKKAFRELIRLGLIVVKNSEDKYSNGHYQIILLNDKYINDWDKYNETFNFKFN